MLDRVDDETISLAIQGVRDLTLRWVCLPPGDALRLSWPLSRDFFISQPTREAGS